MSLFGAAAEYIPHAGLYTSLTFNIVDAGYSVLDLYLFQVHHHVDGRMLDSAVAPFFPVHFADIQEELQSCL